MKKFKRFFIFAVMLFHLPLLYVFSKDAAPGWQYVTAVLLAFFADIVLSFYQTGILTAKHGSLREHVSAFFPFFLEKCVIAAIEYGIYDLLSEQADAPEVRVRYLIWWLFSMGTAALSAVVTFAAGAASTVLYHDKKGT